MLLLKKKIQPQKGQILVLSVILMPLFLIMTILIIEASFFYIKQTQLQSAANAIVLAGIENKTAAAEIVTQNRTVDFNSEGFSIPDDYPKIEGGVHKVELQEAIVPIFGKIFGDTEIMTVTVRSAAINNSSDPKKDRLVPWD